VKLGWCVFFLAVVLLVAGGCGRKGDPKPLWPDAVGPIFITSGGFR